MHGGLMGGVKKKKSNDEKEQVKQGDLQEDKQKEPKKNKPKK